MTLHEIRRNAEEAAISSAKKLRRARLLRNAFYTGYWTAWTEFLEDLIIGLDAISNESDSVRSSRARAERQALDATESLDRALTLRSVEDIGYWKAYIDSREDLLLLLDRVEVLDR